MANNPVHDAPLYKVFGRGTQEAADKWDEIMRALYDEHGIDNTSELARRVDITPSTLYSNGAFKEPHLMTYRTFLRICKSLSVDTSDLWNQYLGWDHVSASEFDESYNEVKGRVNELTNVFLKLKPETQATVLKMISGITEDAAEDNSSNAACELLSLQLNDFMSRCYSWDYIDMS